jgi:type II secretory pathway pseudopilin PulG
LSDAPKILALTVAIAVAIGLGVIWVPRLLGSAGGTEVELITQLKRAERDGVDLPLRGGGRLISHHLTYQRLTVIPDADGKSATVLATLDLTGDFGQTQVSSLGVEKIPFVYDGTDWRPAGSMAPRLVAAVNALEQRRQALEAGDLQQLAQLARVTDGGSLGEDLDAWLQLLERKLRVDAWFIRLERDDAEVSEQYRAEGVGRDRPWRSSGPRKLHLELGAGGEFFFSAGLM